MAKPSRNFDGTEGVSSTGIGGPDQIEQDFDVLFSMLDPNSQLPTTGEQGGMGTENIQDDAITDVKIGNRTINDNISTSYSNVGTLTTLLSFIGKIIKTITGKSNWYTSPQKNIEQICSNIDDINQAADNLAGTGRTTETVKGNADSITELHSTDGASKIGAKSISDLVGSTVQELLQSLKSFLDNAISNVQSQISSPDNDIKDLQGEISSNDYDISVLQNRTSNVEISLSVKAENSDFLNHKSSGDHDNRYYTQEYIDNLVIDGIEYSNILTKLNDNVLSITHNLNDYPNINFMMEAGFGIDGFGFNGFGENSLVQIFNQAEYLDENFLKIRHYSDLDTTPTITQLDSNNYSVSFAGVEATGKLILK